MSLSSGNSISAGFLRTSDLKLRQQSMKIVAREKVARWFSTQI
jgi:hypothetical protein